MKTFEPPDTHFLAAAQGWLELGIYKEAGEELDRIAPELRMHPEVLELRGQIHALGRDWPACIAVGSTLLKLAPERPFGWVHSAFALHAMNRTQEAYEFLLIAVDALPNDWLVRYNLAGYACYLGNHEEGREWLGEAMRLGDRREVKRMVLEDPDLEELWAELAKI